MTEVFYEEAYTTQATSFDGKTSWPCVLKTQLMIGVSAELDHEKRRRAFTSRVEGDIALYEKTLDRDLLKSAEDGVVSFKWIRRPFYVNRA